MAPPPLEDWCASWDGSEVVLRADLAKIARMPARPSPEVDALAVHFCGETPRLGMPLEAEAQLLGLTRNTFPHRLVEYASCTLHIGWAFASGFWKRLGQLIQAEKYRPVAAFKKTSFDETPCNLRVDMLPRLAGPTPAKRLRRRRVTSYRPQTCKVLQSEIGLGLLLEEIGALEEDGPGGVRGNGRYIGGRLRRLTAAPCHSRVAALVRAPGGGATRHGPLLGHLGSRRCEGPSWNRCGSSPAPLRQRERRIRGVVVFIFGFWGETPEKPRGAWAPRRRALGCRGAGTAQEASPRACPAPSATAGGSGAEKGRGRAEGGEGV